MFLSVIAEEHQTCTRYVDHGGDRQPDPAQPRLRLPVGHERLHDRDRHADAPHRMKRQDRLGQLDAHPQRGQVRVTMQEVMTGVRVVPQQLVDRPLFDQRIRGRKKCHHRPAAAAAAAKLPDQQSAAAVQRRQNQPEQRLGKRDIAQQEFGDERCQNEQSKCRAEPSYSAGDQPAALDPRERV